MANKEPYTITEHTDKTVTLTMPEGTDVTELVPTIEVSEGATVSPDSGEAQSSTRKTPRLNTFSIDLVMRNLYFSGSILTRKGHEIKFYRCNV